MGYTFIKFKANLYSNSQHYAKPFLIQSLFIYINIFFFTFNVMENIYSKFFLVFTLSDINLFYCFFDKGNSTIGLRNINW